jgi:hypothetical protein
MYVFGKNTRCWMRPSIGLEREGDIRELRCFERDRKRV